MSSLSVELTILPLIETRLVSNQVEISISRIQEQVCFLSCLVKIQFSVRHKLLDTQSLCSSVRSLFPKGLQLFVTFHQLLWSSTCSHRLHEFRRLLQVAHVKSAKICEK